MLVASFRLLVVYSNDLSKAHARARAHTSRVLIAIHLHIYISFSYFYIYLYLCVFVCVCVCVCLSASKKQCFQCFIIFVSFNAAKIFFLLICKIFSLVHEVECGKKKLLEQCWRLFDAVFMIK